MHDKTMDAFGPSDIPPETADHILIARLRDRETRLVKALEPLLESAKNSRQIATSQMGRRYIRAAEAALADSE